MINSIKTTISAITIVTLLSGCLDFEELRVNPNDPSSVAPSLLLTEVLPRPSGAWGSTFEYAQYCLFVHADSRTLDYDAYEWTQPGFSYGRLRNISKMESEAEKVNAPAYLALAKFLKAYTFIEMARRHGDIPMSETLMAEEGVFEPVYDTQKQVFVRSLNLLNEANADLANLIQNSPGLTVDGDVYFNGDLKQWQKIINAYTLRILITLSAKEEDTDLKVKERFAAIVNNPAQYPLLEGLEDNMQLTHKDEDGFRYSLNPNNASTIDGKVLGKTYVEMLKKYEDPRLFKVADPTPASLEADPDAASKFESYIGVDISKNNTDLINQKSAGNVSKPNNARYVNHKGEPSIFLGYVEQELTIAEAIHRGWFNGDAKMHFDNGVKASMKFYGVGEADIAAYLSGWAAYKTGEEGLVQLLEQKYIAYSQNSGWEAFFTQRRTGIPSFDVSVENSRSGQIPVRWRYPHSESQYNKTNLTEALNRQFGGPVDDVLNPLWHLQ
ncbi:SusD/RagB family nutrient-binding outer membrane lipoprotein [Rapidithrix thailandica]|uniref:SusD/RagB family nutrient-binding outer membrane lipoprotein n=1 Tax=Rapidithrix thailandica TaxID=413964 RepID=A0AAW9S8M0_9BACT